MFDGRFTHQRALVDLVYRVVLEVLQVLQVLEVLSLRHGTRTHDL